MSTGIQKNLEPFPRNDSGGTRPDLFVTLIQAAITTEIPAGNDSDATNRHSAANSRRAVKQEGAQP